MNLEQQQQWSSFSSLVSRSISKYLSLHGCSSTFHSFSFSAFSPSTIIRPSESQKESLELPLTSERASDITIADSTRRIRHDGLR